MAVKENEMIADTTMLILSCDKYSDLWDGQVKLLKQNWPDCNYTILIVTDKESSLNYDNVKIFPTGQDLEWSQRLAMVLSSIDTKYVFITLDDYYLINKVDNNKITEIYKMMESYSLDYVRLFSRPTKATLNKIEDYSNAYTIDVSFPYAVNLYAGIWKKEFLEYTVREPLSAWSFEVRLSKIAEEYGAKGAVVKDVYNILDVVRKGKLLRSAAKYFNKNPNIYTGHRKINSVYDELKLFVLTVSADIIPIRFQKPIKKIMNRFGYTFFSDELQE